ncbi:MAG TPA: queuosine salvage family protein [Solirubrobacteraceae bacterium]|nr:queuosine salvage family protein [Solirubrobacteraceae bacterium]
MQALRQACAAVAARAKYVAVAADAIPQYAAALPLPGRAEGPNGPAPGPGGPQDAPPPAGADRERLAAFWLTLDAVNFGSGWFPTLRKRPGLSGYNTVAAALRDRFNAAGPWSATELTEITAPEIAGLLGQDPGHELMALFATSLNDLGRRVAGGHQGEFAAVADAAGGSAVALATALGAWDCFADCSAYDGLEIPFLKRAQIAAADLHRAGVTRFADLGGLTMFADNLVPHVLRLDGVLRFDADLVARIDREELIPHDSPEEIEIRACAVHAVELISAAAGVEGVTAAEIDQVLWERGQQSVYKASPRHRSRCTAY